MEDAHNVVLDFAKKNGMSDFFGIYDGHAGDEVAKLCADKMPKVHTFRDDNVWRGGLPTGWV